MKKKDQFARLLAFIDRLEQAEIPFELRRDRYDGVSVVTSAPGEMWQVDFLDDGTIDIERFHSNGHIDDEDALEELFALWSDAEKPAAKDGANARK